MQFSGEKQKKAFLYLSSVVGKGYIISDDEEVTGVISVRTKGNQRLRRRSRKVSSDTKTQTLEKRKRRKPREEKENNFLFVNKPHYSSDSSIEISSTSDFKEKVENPWRNDQGMYGSELLLRRISRYDTMAI